MTTWGGLWLALRQHGGRHKINTRTTCCCLDLTCMALVRARLSLPGPRCTYLCTLLGVCEHEKFKGRRRLWRLGGHITAVLPMPMHPLRSLFHGFDCPCGAFEWGGWLSVILSAGCTNEGHHQLNKNDSSLHEMWAQLCQNLAGRKNRRKARCLTLRKQYSRQLGVMVRNQSY